MVDSVIRGDGGYVQKYWGDLNGTEYSAIRAYMGRTEAGQKVLAAADNRSIVLNFSDDLPPSPGTIGWAKKDSAHMYLRQTENGSIPWVTYGGDHVGALEFTANKGVHEGLHAMGITGSRRAEALVRLEELRSMGRPIDRNAMRQVLGEMRSTPTTRRGPEFAKNSYDMLPWRTVASQNGQAVRFMGSTISSFPGVVF